jgi:uncharacterized protein YqeY
MKATSEPLGDMDKSKLRTRLQADLKTAMKTRDTLSTAVLRFVLAALDNASAIPIDSTHVRVHGKSGDVSGRQLTEADCAAILQHEADNRLAAAKDYENLGRAEVAARLRGESAIIGRYLQL